MADPTKIMQIAQHLADTAHEAADRQNAATILESITSSPTTRNCDMLLAIAGMIAAEGAHAARDNNVPPSVAISIIAGAVSILAQYVGQDMHTPPRPEDLN